MDTMREIEKDVPMPAWGRVVAIEFILGMKWRSATVSFCHIGTPRVHML